MDCCNYMQYRHHQYYGTQYYEPMPQYHGDFYNQQMYQEYYGNTPYYQQWPCAASFPDYVYNPKEARIRKAMRDATRERSIGTSPMLQRPNARRPSSSHGWVPTQQQQHDELMMSPMGNMQGAPVCGFQMSSGGGGEQFMGAMNAYNKLEAAPPPPMPQSTANYMQSNPLAQLQQHAEMWPDYQTMRSRSAGNPFIMGDVPPYAGQTPEMGANLMMEKEPPPATSPPTIQTELEKEREHFMPVFEQDETKMKKPQSYEDVIHLPFSSQNFRASLFSNDLNYQNHYILEYFQSMPSMTLMNVTTPNGVSFPYATYSPGNLMEHVTNETQVFENVTEPIFFHTDVGFVPMSAM